MVHDSPHLRGHEGRQRWLSRRPRTSGIVEADETYFGKTEGHGKGPHLCTTAKIGKGFASHETVNHSGGEYARGDVTTNTVEGYLGILKRGISGI